MHLCRDCHFYVEQPDASKPDGTHCTASGNFVHRQDYVNGGLVKHALSYSAAVLRENPEMCGADGKWFRAKVVSTVTEVA